MSYTIEEIHNSLINGQRKQMVKQIDAYGTYEFWEDFKGYLLGAYCMAKAFELFADATISYFNIKA